MENHYSQLYFGSIHMLVAIVLFCSLLLWSQRDDGQRSRRFLVWTWLFLLVLCAGWLPIIYRGDPIFEGVFPIEVLIFGMALVAVMTIYPIEVVAPWWLNKKRLLLLFSPVILIFAMCAAIHFFGGGFRSLETMDDIARYSHEPNVWIRFSIVLFICGYAFILYYIPQNKIRSNIRLNWIRAYTFGNTGIAIFYLGLILFGPYPAGILHILYFALYVGYITYQELYVRLFIPDSENTRSNAAGRKANKPWSEKEQNLWIKIENHMQSELAWHNPNLSTSLLANAVEATQTEIITLLKSIGYDEFDDFVAEFRIREFCNLINRGDNITIEDIFFRVGFRYRDTAFKQFTRIMHQSPEEYFQKKR